MIKKIQRRLLSEINLLQGYPDKLKYMVGLEDSKALILPNFLCIGAQKAGTSWLYKNLRLHPEVFIPENRYIHYFDRHFNKSLKSYSDNFKLGENQTKGEVIPGYGLIKCNRIRFVHKIIPELKLIFIIRNPIERAWSHAVMGLVKDKNRKIEDVSEDDFIQHFHSKLSKTKGNYIKIIDNWTKIFPKEALFLAFNDQILESPEVLLKNIFHHIGVSKLSSFEDFNLGERVNKGLKVEASERCMNILKEIHRPQILEIQKRYGSYSLNWET